ncbi:DPY30 domain-containing protein 2-like [Diaphorina citri]|uniref:DPY30 domain-containing protein 2-like n=1 Tax=Diaphorina citri TaxID=121845 RepID=A0A1S3DPV7_DIACI|nr:DPY30 domain-containing protein 2-like [Diaphorina citri]
MLTSIISFPPGWGDSSDSICHYGGTSQVGSKDGSFGTQPRPNIAIIEKTFPDNLLAKACAEIARKRPDNPIRYLAFYLMNHEKNQKRNEKYAAHLEAMMEYKKTLEELNVESLQEDEMFDLPEELDVDEGDEMNFETENESLPMH